MEWKSQLNQQGIQQRTPLMVALVCNNVEMVKLLVCQKEIDLSVCSYDETAYEIAQDRNNEACLYFKQYIEHKHKPPLAQEEAF